VSVVVWLVVVVYGYQLSTYGLSEGLVVCINCQHSCPCRFLTDGYMGIVLL
jgi:hypothetical protein